MGRILHTQRVKMRRERRYKHIHYISTANNFMNFRLHKLFSMYPEAENLHTCIAEAVQPAQD